MSLNKAKLIGLKDKLAEKEAAEINVDVVSVEEKEVEVQEVKEEIKKVKKGK